MCSSVPAGVVRVFCCLNVKKKNHSSLGQITYNLTRTYKSTQHVCRMSLEYLLVLRLVMLYVSKCYSRFSRHLKTTFTFV